MALSEQRKKELENMLAQPAQAPVRKSSLSDSRKQELEMILSKSTQPQQLSTPNVVKDALSGIARSVAGTGARVASTVAKVQNPVISSIARFLPEDVQTPIGTVGVQYSKSPVKAVGQGLQDVANLYSGGTGVGLTKLGYQGAKGLFPGLARLSGTFGAQSGATMAGEALEAGKPLATAAKEGAVGFGTGVALGLTGGVLGNVVGRAARQVGAKLNVPAAVQIQNKLATTKSLDKVKNAIPEIKKSNIALEDFKTTFNEDPIEYMMSSGIPLEVQGKSIVTKTGKTRLDEIRDSIGRDRDYVFSQVTEPTANKQDLVTLAINKLQNALIDNTGRQKMIKFISQRMKAEPEALSPKELTKLKSAWDRKVKYERMSTPTEQQEAFKALADAARELAEQGVMKVNPQSANIINILNKEFSKTYKIQNVLDSLRGTKVKNGRVGDMFARLSGNVVGAKLGPIGSLITGEAFAKLSTFLKDPSRLTSDAIEQLQKSGSVPSYLKSKDDVVAWIQALQYSRMPKALPEARSPVTESVISLPSARDAEIQAMRRNLEPTPFTPSPSGPGVPQVPVGVPVRQPIALPQQTVPQSNPIATPFTMMEQGVPVKKVKSGAYSSNLQRRLTPERVVEGKVVEKTVSDDLIKEAKKYKTPEEFVKAQGTPVYHGTASDFEMFDPKFKGYSTGADSAKGAFWFTDDEATARAYAVYAAEDAPVQRILKEAEEVMKQAQRTNDSKLWDKYDDLIRKSEELAEYDNTYKRRQDLAKVKEAYVSGEFLEVDAKGKTPQELSSDDNIDSWLNSKIKEAIKKNKSGLKIINIDDAVGLYDRPSTHYAVFNPEQIKTKSQLEEIWKKANQATPESSLINEAKKYKTPEEFVKDIQQKSGRVDKGSTPTLIFAEKRGSTFQDLYDVSPERLEGRTGFKTPPKTVKVYRGVKDNKFDIQVGDYVTTDKTYAQKYGDIVQEMEIPAEDLRYMWGSAKGNQLGEFPEYVYYKTKSQLEDIWKKANKPKLPKKK